MPKKKLTAEELEALTVHFGHCPVSVQHRTSGAYLTGLCTTWDKYKCLFYVHFPLSDTYAFSARTGRGREQGCKMWTIPLDGLRRLREEPGYTVPAEKPRKPRAARKPKPADPRQIDLL